MTNSAIGVDLGSYKSVMGVVKKGGIDIVLNDASGRQTPVCVAYQQLERLIGNACQQQVKRNFKNTILFPTRFLGLNATCKEQLALEERFTTHKIIPQENNKLAFEVRSMGQVHQFNTEQVIAFYLKKLKTYYEKSGYTSKDFVISIPSYATNVERQALLDAAEIAGLKCLRVINESTAIVLNYGFFRKNQLDEKKEKVVAFVDVGHSKTTITIASFKRGEAKIIVHNSDRNLGAREFDYEMTQVIGEEFAKKFGDDPRKNARCKFRMYEACEKARKILSGDTEASINIDYLLNEEDLNRKINRDEFQQMIDGQVRRFTNLIQETIQMSGLDADQIESVELIGDATRTPILIDQMKMLFKKTELQRTLNSLEVVARGAALNCAMLTPNFSVQAFKLADYNAMPVSIQYNFNAAENQEPKHYPKFFQIGQKFPMAQELKFANKEGDLTLSINYDRPSPLLNGLPETIAQYKIGKGTKKKADVEGGSKTGLIIRVRNNLHQIPELESVSMTESWTEIEKIPIAPAKKAAPAKKPEEKKEEGKEGEAAAAGGEEQKEGEVKPEQPAEQPKEEAPAEPAPEQKYEEKKRTRERTYDVQFSTISHATPPDQRAAFQKIEADLYKADREILDVKEARNDLEAYSYDMKSNCDQYGNYEAYIDPTLKDPFLQNLQATVDWIYGEGENAPLKEYQDRMAALGAIGNPVKARYRFRSEIGEWIDLFSKFKTTVVQPKLAEAAAGKAPNLTEERQKSIIDKVEVVDTYFAEINAALEKPKTEDLPYTIEQVENKIEALKAEVTTIFNLPVPTIPKKEEEKKEEAKAGEEGKEKPAQEGEPAAEGENKPADVEMNQEAPTEQPAAAESQQDQPMDQK